MRRILAYEAKERPIYARFETIRRLLGGKHPNLQHDDRPMHSLSAIASPSDNEPRPRSSRRRVRLVELRRHRFAVEPQRGRSNEANRRQSARRIRSLFDRHSKGPVETTLRPRSVVERRKRRRPSSPSRSTSPIRNRVDGRNRGDDVSRRRTNESIRRRISSGFAPLLR